MRIKSIEILSFSSPEEIERRKSFVDSVLIFFGEDLIFTHTLITSISLIRRTSTDFIDDREEGDLLEKIL